MDDRQVIEFLVGGITIVSSGIWTMFQRRINKLEEKIVEVEKNSASQSSLDHHSKFMAKGIGDLTTVIRDSITSANTRSEEIRKDITDLERSTNARTSVLIAEVHKKVETSVRDLRQEIAELRRGKPT